MLQRRVAREPGYGGVAKGLHWLIVGLLVAQFAVAWTMPAIRRGTQPEGLVGLHLSFGIAIMLLAALRLLWRLYRPVPLLADGVPWWQHRAAQLSHAALYALLFLLPILGWANASARGWKIAVFGLFDMPHIWPAGSAFGRAELGGIHVWGTYALLGLVGLHVLAALYHHLWLRDRVLSRMLPYG
ncbi:MAG TPA: cytochrome b/b6 domain-containing protein [Stellaceae bacterium]|nr:cytochrome b/b6 domain-containing protein [Stellaceae bacterium]